MKQYDAIIIGFGKGGKLLAAELANRNWKVAIIERSPQMYGGTCVNAGCIPTKTLIHESEQAERLYRDDYSNQAKYYALAVGRKNKLVSFLRDKNYEHIKAHPNITLYDGTASFASNDTVKVVSRDKKEILLKGKEVFINTGSTPILPDVEGINGSKHVFTSETLLRQSKLPHRLLILGAGAIGMELATMYAGFGSQVTLLESGSRFMPKSDRDIAESMLESLKRKGIEIRLNAYALSVYDTDDGVTLTYTDNADGTPYFLEGDALLLATGRRPMTDELNLHAAGIRTVKRGYSLQVSRLPVAAIPRARTLQHIDGMMKAIVNAHTGRIIGCTLFCVDAPEVINLVSLAMKNDLHYSALRDFIFTHPSMSEGLNDLFKAF